MTSDAELKAMRERDDRWTGSKLLALAFATVGMAITVILIISK